MTIFWSLDAKEEIACEKTNIEIDEQMTGL